MIDAIHSAEILKSNFVEEPVFGLQIPKQCPNVPDEVLIPENLWKSKAAYKKQLNQLAALFNKNFEKYKAGSSESIRNAGPKL